MVFVKESLDNTVRSPEDLKTVLNIPALAIIPLVSAKSGQSPGKSKAVTHASSVDLLPEVQNDPAWRVFLERPKSAEGEAIRSLHTSIMLSRAGHPPRTLLVVSPSPSKGKTTVALNLAMVCSNHGKTCLVDADLRRPMIARSLGLDTKVGISNVLTGASTLEGALICVSTKFPNLSMLPVGPIPPNPGELVSSQHMREMIVNLRKEFEFVVIDSAPVIPFADARSLSQVTDCAILVGRAGKTTRRALVRCAELLSQHRATILGFVLNCVDLRSPDYSYYNYGYTGSYGDGYGHYPYSDDDDQSGKEDSEGL